MAALPGKPGDREKLIAAGSSPACATWISGQVMISSSIPDVVYGCVFHAAVDPGKDDWRRCVETNAQRSGDLLFHCKQAKRLCLPLYRLGLSLSRKTVNRSRCTWRTAVRANCSFFGNRRGICMHMDFANQFNIPLTIIRICSTYGPEGGTPCDRLEAILQRKPIRLHPDKPTQCTISRGTKTIMSITASRALGVASVPPITVNWSGSETVSCRKITARIWAGLGWELNRYLNTPRKRTHRFGQTLPTCTKFSAQPKCIGAMVFAA